MMSNDDIVRAAKALREMLDSLYPEVVAGEMEESQKAMRKGLYTEVQIGHCKWECEKNTRVHR